MTMMLHRQLLLLCLIIISSLILNCLGSSNSAAGSGGGGGGRHSYSLSTFNPMGEIDQVVRAVKASMLGVPIVALATSSSGKTGDDRGGCRGIYISMPLRSIASSPLIIDDGTPRIVRLTSTLCVVHTGVNADGRALCDVATAMALDYVYIYGMEITVEELLAGLADKMQEMTMKAGSRPYGCALLVACLGSSSSSSSDDNNDDDYDRPTMYRVDPNGAVVLLTPLVDDTGAEDSESAITSLDDDMDANYVVRGRRRGSSSVAFLGDWGRNLRQKIAQMKSQLTHERYANESEIKNLLLDIVKQYFVDDSESSWSTTSEENIIHQSKETLLKQHPMLFASFTREYGLRLSRIDG